MPRASHWVYLGETILTGFPECEEEQVCSKFISGGDKIQIRKRTVFCRKTFRQNATEEYSRRYQQCDFLKKKKKFSNDSTKILLAFYKMFKLVFFIMASYV